jgi:dTDP-4-dehydrorhamnose 3,5-epimerase
VIFTETALSGAFLIDPERREDSRGYFARAFCQHEFAEHGLKPVIAQANVAFNNVAGTLRGMHFQFPPKPETKIVRATRGAIVDIIVDLRPESPTYLQHVAVRLDEENSRSLYVPERFAHGYQTLADATETSYYVGALRGVLYRLCPEARLVDITHQIASFSPLEASFVLSQACPEFPPGTIHLAVVDPGVGGLRRPLIIRTERFAFVGPRCDEGHAASGPRIAKGTASLAPARLSASRLAASART